MSDDLIGRVIRLSRERRFDEALSVIDDGIRDDPRNGLLHVRRAYVLIAMSKAGPDRSRDAGAEFDLAAELEPENAAIREARGDYALLCGAFDAAIHEFSLAIRFGGESVHRLFQRGMAGVQSKYADRALADFDRAIELDPEHDNSRQMRALALNKLGRKEEALTAIDAEIARAPDAHAYILRATLVDPADYAQRIADAGKAADLAPDDPNIQASLADVLLASGKSLAALDIFRTLNERQPGVISGMRGLADALRDSGRLQEAIELYDRVVAEDPTYVLGWLGRGRAHTEAQHHQLAVADLTRAIEIEPEAYEALNYRARAWLALGRLGAAQEDIDLFLGKWPDRGDGLLVLAMVRKQQGRLDEAEKAARRAIETLGKRADSYLCWVELADVLALNADRMRGLNRKLRYKEAFECLDNAARVCSVERRQFVFQCRQSIDARFQAGNV